MVFLGSQTPIGFFGDLKAFLNIPQEVGKVTLLSTDVNPN